MIEMESKYGVRTVGVHVQVFARLVDSVARAKGMPRARQAFVPVPMFNQPPAVLRGYVEGDDPVHGGAVMGRGVGLPAGPARGGGGRCGGGGAAPATSSSASTGRRSGWSSGSPRSRRWP